MRSVDGVALLSAIGGLAAAASAQALVTRQPWASLLGFTLGAALFGWSAWRTRDWPADDPAPPGPLPTTVLALFGLAMGLCGTAGWLVYAGSAARTPHALWGAGLVALAAAALAAPRPSSTLEPLTPRQRGALCAVAALAALLLGWELTSVPTEVHGDDAEVGLDALRLLADFNLFGAGWFELPRLHALPTAIGLKLFGPTLLGLRATSAVLAWLGVLLLFAVARRLWNVEIALLAALLLAGQRFWIHLGRAGYHYVDTPVLALLAVWLFLRLWQERRLGAAIACGVALGLGIQTYYASRLVPVLLTLTWLAWLPGMARRQWRRDEWRGQAAGFALIGVAALAVAAPIFGYFAHDWGAFWERTRDTSLFNAAALRHLSFGYGTDSLAGILAIQLRAALTLFNLTEDNSLQYGLHGGLLEPASAALFVLGAGLALARLGERRMRLLVIWILVPLVAGAALTIDAPFYPRISGLVPFTMLMVAVALGHLLRLVRAAAPGRTGRWAVGLALAAVVALILAVNARTYFVDYAPRHRHAPSVEIAAFVRHHGVGKTTYMLGGAPAFFIRHGAIAFLTWGETTHDVERPEAFLRDATLDPRRSVFVIMPAGTHLIPQLEAAVGPVDLQTHRSRFGEVAFLTAIPSAAGDAPDPPEQLVQSGEPGPGAQRLGRLLAGVERGAAALLVLAGGAVLLVVGVAARRRPRTPGLSALRPPLGERLAHWRTRLAGPDARERALAPPRWATLTLLAVVLALALGLRTHRLTELPAGFFCDEAGNGFNTGSLLYAGRDETGARWPLYIWSFGVSYKNPVFVYSAMLPMAVLGPTELAVRLTAALWGTATVLAMFFLGRALMGPLVGLVAALLLAVVPWHLHFSRIGFELITLPFFFTVALTCLVRWTQGQRRLGMAAVLLGLCLYTYVPAKLFVPLFLLGFAALYQRPLRARWRESLLAAALLVVTVTPLAIFDLVHRGQAGSYFEQTTILAQGGGPLQLARRFAGNYAEFFSREFLFAASNDRIIRHSVGEHGQLYPFFAPLLALGVGLALLRRDRALRLPLLWLALYPCAAALMNEIPSASRGFIGAPAFCLVAALGAGALLRLPALLGARRAVTWGLQSALLAALLVAVVPAARAYWILYRDQYPLYSAKQYTGFQYGHRRVLEVFRERYDDFDRLLLTTRRSNQPEVFLRFYDGLRRPERPGAAPPFEHGEKMVAGSAESYELVVPGQRTLFAVLPEEVPLFADGEVLERVIAPDGSAAFVLVAASRLKDFVSTWRVGGQFPDDDRSPPPDWTPETAPDEMPAGAYWRLHEPLSAGVPLNDFFAPNVEYACAWAVNFVSSDVDRDLRAVVGFDDRGEVWVNGTRLRLRAATDPELTLVDSQSGALHLQPGRNTIAVRSCEEIGDWRFYFRLENPDGSPAQGLQWAYGPRRRPE